MTTKAPTIRDVALRAGVSVATASNVVNGNRPVGKESRRRVLEAVAAIGYRLNRAASSLRGAPSRLIGMVVPDIANVFFGELVRDVEELAENNGYDLLLVTTSEDPTIERRRIEALVSRRIDGLLVVPARDDSIASLLSGPDGAFMPPTVLIDRGDPSPSLDTAMKGTPALSRSRPAWPSAASAHSMPRSSRRPRNRLLTNRESSTMRARKITSQKAAYAAFVLPSVMGSSRSGLSITSRLSLSL